MADEGYIKLNRKMLNWEWYQDVNTKVLFLHCLLKANWKDAKFRGQEIKRGQFVTSLQHLADETNLSVKNVRTALDHLKATGELADLRQGNYRLITVLNYCRYQDDGKPTGNPSANHRQSIGNPSATIEESKEYIEEGKESKEYIPPLYPPKGKTTKQAKADRNIELFDQMASGYGFSETMTAKISDWLKYKGLEKGDEYKETGLKSLLTQISKSVEEHGEYATVDVIDLSMANQYKGILWDRLKDSKPKSGNSGYTFADMWKDDYG